MGAQLSASVSVLRITGAQSASGQEVGYLNLKLILVAQKFLYYSLENYLGSSLRMELQINVSDHKTNRTIK